MAPSTDGSRPASATRLARSSILSLARRLLGVLSNLVGLLYLLGRMRRHALFPRHSSLLSASVAWPVDRALPYGSVSSVLVLLVALVVTFA